MTIRSILVPICPNVASESQLEAALGIARKVEGHINAVYFRPDPITTVAAIPEVALAAGVAIEQVERDDREAEAAAHDKFEAWRREHGLAAGMIDQSLRTPYARWSDRVGSLEAGLMRCGRLSDLIVLNYPTPYSPATERAFDTAVFGTGRPTIIVREKVPNDLLRNVVVAWNGSLEATRAVAGAMTLLHRAERVSIFAAPRHAEDSLEELDLIEALTWHGIHAHPLAPRAGESSVGAALFRAATEQDATLIVMGAYTHSRVRQFMLGGVTSHVLRHAAMPVLMMH